MYRLGADREQPHLLRLKGHQIYQVKPFLRNHLMALDYEIQCSGEQNTYFTVWSSLSRLVCCIDNPDETLNCSKIQGITIGHLAWQRLGATRDLQKGEEIIPDILHRVGVKSPPKEVFEALSTIEGRSHWWVTDTTGNAKQGGIIHFGLADLKVVLKRGSLSTTGPEGMRLSSLKRWPKNSNSKRHVFKRTPFLACCHPTFYVPPLPFKSTCLAYSSST
jgi:hypothetical protein